MSRADRFMNACRKQPVDCTPVWLMRQAGRYLKEYQEIRKNVSFMDLCKNPELACEVSLQPIRRFELDAAIIFSDLLVPVEAMGIELDIIEQKGPVIFDPIRSKAAVDKLPSFEPEEETAYLLEAIRLLGRELNGKVPVIGFAGAPFTLGSYMVEGSHSRNYIHIKSLMFNQPDVHDALMTKLSDIISKYLNAQIKAGAQAVQIFDTWAGCLAPQDYKRFVLPYTRRVVDGIEDKSVPVIHYLNGNPALLDMLTDVGADILSIDWRIDLDVAWRRIGSEFGVQGNLDPVILFSRPEVVEDRVKDVLVRAANAPGHIFNLGHGILPQTPVENVKLLIDTVHAHSRRSE
jgi:uroporphyrinogen decarboxylase